MNIDKDFHYRSVLRFAFKLVKEDYQLFVSHKCYRVISCIAKSKDRKQLNDDLNRLESSLLFMLHMVQYIKMVNYELLKPRKFKRKKVSSFENFDKNSEFAPKPYFEYVP